MVLSDTTPITGPSTPISTPFPDQPTHHARARSDTIASSSSISSLDFPQTPQTPSILAVLYGDEGMEVENADKARRVIMRNDTVDKTGCDASLEVISPSVNPSQRQPIPRNAEQDHGRPAHIYQSMNKAAHSADRPIINNTDVPDLIAIALEPRIEYPFPNASTPPSSEIINRTPSSRSISTHTSAKTSLREAARARFPRSTSRRSLNNDHIVLGTGPASLTLGGVRDDRRKSEMRSLLALTRRKTESSTLVTTTNSLAHGEDGKMHGARVDLSAQNLPILSIPIPSDGEAGKEKPDTASRTAAMQKKRAIDSCLFHELLPREIHLIIFKTLATTFEGAKGRWIGSEAGQRELIKLTRVCKSWQSLCLDGQLWPVVNITPFISRMHPNTLHKIIKSSEPFIKNLNLQGCDNISGVTLTHTLISCTTTLSSLLHLDLRGCSSLDTLTISILLSLSPALETLNLKGVQAVTSDTLRTMRSSNPRMHTLDVSRCWNLTITDLAVHSRALTSDQAARVRCLKIAGLKGYGPNSRKLLSVLAEKCYLLEILDLGGCESIKDEDWESWAAVLDGDSLSSNLKHLNISGCDGLTSRTFRYMEGRMPDLEILEMTDMIQELSGSQENDLIGFFKGLNRLRKIDIEGNAGLSDRVLDCLSGKYLEEVKFSFCRGFTSEGLIRFLRGCPKLKGFEVDNTSANDAVLRVWMKRHHATDTIISVIDCRGITPGAYAKVAPVSRPRDGWGEGRIEASPFGYTTEEGGGESSSEQFKRKGVVKCFEGWKRVAINQEWTKMRDDWEKEVVIGKQDTCIGRPSVGVTRGKYSSGRVKTIGRRGRTLPEEAHLKGSCTIM